MAGIRGITRNYSYKNIKDLLQKATVIGKDFFLKMLSLLQGKLGLNEKVIEDLNKLEDEKFIQEFINEPEHYKFKHIL